MNRSDIWIAVLERLDGPRWVLWALLFGLIAVLATALVLVPLALAIGHDPRALTTFGLMIELFSLSLVGSGMLDSMTRKLSQGGLTRDSTELEERLSKEEREKRDEEEKERKDRRTMRAATTVLPILVAFVALLFA